MVAAHMRRLAALQSHEPGRQKSGSPRRHRLLSAGQAMASPRPRPAISRRAVIGGMGGGNQRVRRPKKNRPAAGKAARRCLPAVLGGKITPAVGG